MRRPASYMEGMLVRHGITGIGFILTIVLIYMGLWPVGVVVVSIATWLYVAWYFRQAKLARAMKKAHLEH